MTLELLKGKIHRATVVQAELDYVGSITVDEALLEAAGILEYEKVQIVDVNNGSLRMIHHQRTAWEWNDLLKRSCCKMCQYRR